VSFLEVTNLTRRFGGLSAVTDLNFTVKRGSIVALIGPNGAGKTTTFSVISGFQRPTAGDVIFNGERITGLSPDAICVRGLARTFQIMQAFPKLTTLENVMIGAYVRHRTMGAARNHALDILQRLGMAARRNDFAGNLTLADLKRLEIAKALATSPELLLLDEVVSGLTPTEVEELIVLIRGIRDSGITIVMIEHVMQAVMALADTIVVLHHGEKIFEGLPRAAIADPLVIEAYLGEELAVA
jgi:branched-chain amino acid transport system ATP-binding protein